ncbi:hypothetical protein EVAR_27717_1 [Eumeta japonica]|uniref:Uncharacterized protein n=1 Tax=Eumeta variegata TaxID=151549 RepID=A0A4C1WRN5_EUMVA|nr:hypothetical protein EVAR_27717_1 [Eumeta japonica]
MQFGACNMQCWRRPRAGARADAPHPHCGFAVCADGPPLLRLQFEILALKFSSILCIQSFLPLVISKEKEYLKGQRFEDDEAVVALFNLAKVGSLRGRAQYHLARLAVLSLALFYASEWRFIAEPTAAAAAVSSPGPCALHAINRPPRPPPLAVNSLLRSSARAHLPPSVVYDRDSCSTTTPEGTLRSRPCARLGDRRRRTPALCTL